jgi:F0F1-type ATP synthase membrane subunit b/b'
MHALVFPILNLAVLFSALFYFLRTPVQKAVLGRHESLKNELGEVRNRLQEARIRYDEFSAKLKAIHVEVSSIQSQARQDAEATRNRIVSSAKSSASSILSEAKARAEGMVVDARQNLRAELGTKIVQRAERLIHDRLTGDDRVRIRKEFSERVGTIQ